MNKIRTITLAATIAFFSILSSVIAVAEPSISEPAVIALVDINTADESTLTTLKGVGVKKAQAIVAFRAVNGDFKSVEELLNVKGIGENVLLANKQKIKI